MVNRRISSDLKDTALRLWESGWDVADICDILQVSQASLYRWRQIFDEYGTVTKPPSPLLGRPRTICRAVLTGLHLLIHDSPDTYLDELVWWLAIEHHISISISALHVVLTQAGLTRKLLRKLAIERDEQLREDWRQLFHDQLQPDGTQLVFVDETSKNDRSYFRRYGRSQRGERAELKDVFVRGDRYSLAAAIACDGYIAARAVPGSYDSFEFFDFIAEEVIPNMNPFPLERSVLVIDNCRIHHNEALRDLVSAAGCILLYLPAYSPDLNPIEESFGTLKHYIRRHAATIRIEDDPIAALIECCGCITADMCREWFRHAGYIRE